MSLSLEKLRLKEDKKVKRKIQKQEAKKLAQERKEEDLRESNLPKTEEPEGTQTCRSWKQCLPVSKYSRNVLHIFTESNTAFS